MKKILIFMACICAFAGTMQARKQIIRWEGKKADGIYEFTLHGAKSKTWRMEVKDGIIKPIYTGASHVNVVKDITINPDNDLIEINTAGWCFQKLSMRALEGALKGTKISSGKLAPISWCTTIRYAVGPWMGKFDISYESD